MKRFIIIIVLICASTSSIIAQAQTDESTDSLSKELQEVIVTANQPATKLVGTTLVTTIPGTDLQNIGTALDMLAQLPMITVADNAVSVIGKGAPEIIIDGRPMRSDSELLELQSSNIKKVELLMAPGAMYASTTRAVLKITTLHRFIDGLSLTERAEASFLRKISANDMLDLNYHLGKWDIFLNGGVNHNDIVIKGNTTNSFTFEGKPTLIGSSQYNRCPATVGGVTPGFNYSNDDISFGGYYRFNPEHGNFENNGSEWMNDDKHIHRIIKREINAHSHLAALYYDQTISERINLHFDGNYKNSDSSNNISTSYPDMDAPDVHSADKRRSSLWAGKLYLSFPLAKGNFTVGTQDSYTRTSLDYRMLNQEVSEYIPSSITDARQTSAAAFASWTRSFGKLNFSAGLRYEYVDYLFKVNDVKDEEISSTDHFLTPDISLGYSFAYDSQISLSYKMATVKPPYSQLTGSLSYVGIHEIEGGNPALRDERMHDVQLFGMWRGFMLQADYTRSIDTYAFVKRIYPAPSLQLIMQPININVSAFDIYLIWSRKVKLWTPNITLGMHKQWLDISGTKYNRPIFSYYFDNMFSLPNDFLLTLNASGSTEGDMHTNRFSTTWFTLNASVSKSLLNDALQIKLSATDIFNTLCNDWTMTTYGIDVRKHQGYDNRGISLSLTYRFQPRQSKYKGQSASEDEMKRL